MEEIYVKMWELAKPYYEKGRPMDVEHIEWMMEEAEILCEMEKIDKTILMPIVILHDVGYGVTGPVYFEENLKKEHMEVGSKIAKEILESMKYPKEKIKKIVYCISVHDNWLFGEVELYKKSKMIGTFNDLDFMWMTSPKGFSAMKKVLNKNDEELIEFIENCDKLKTYGFATKITKERYYMYMDERKNEQERTS